MAIQLTNNEKRYGLIAAGLHWLVALAVIGLLVVGLLMTRMEPSPDTFRLYFLHKSVGMTILLIVAVRLLWRLWQSPPGSPSNHKKWEKILAKAIHYGFYAALFALPLSGWVMSSAKGFPVNLFGLFTLPDFVQKSETLAQNAEEAHEIIAYSLIAMVGLHVAGALKHHLIDRDDTLRRMIPGLKLRQTVSAWLTALILTTAPLHAIAAPQAWQVIQDESSLTFEGTQTGAPFTGNFESFSGDIRFAVDNLAESRVEIIIETASAQTGEKERDTYITKEVWFDVKNHPEARFTAEAFRHLEGDQFEADGQLTIKGVTKDITLPFTLSITENEKGQHAQVQGAVTVQRNDFNIGSGDWATSDMVGQDVTIRFDVSAKAVQDDAPAAE